MNAKEQALQDLQAARVALAHHGRLAAEEWSPRAVIGRSFEKHRIWWLSGALLAGLIVIRGLRSPVSTNNGRDIPVVAAKNRTLWSFVLGPVIALGRRKVLDQASQFFESYFKHQFSPNTPPSKEV
ncbi:MAG: hypothetical protein R3F13_21090 [Prosthecobacter sp.]